MGHNKFMIDEYKQNKFLYDEFALRIQSLLSDILEKENIPYHKIETRAKTVSSLEGKIDRKGKYNNLSEIKDLVGSRIILFYSEDIDATREVIEREFVSDLSNFSDKRDKKYNEFGYTSLHLVLRLNRKRANLPEYSNYSNIDFELQIRTMLQHTWAEIEHDLGYKTAYEIPDELKRGFARLAGLLEIADDEFVRLKEDIQKEEKEQVLIDEIVGVQNQKQRIQSLFSEPVFQEILYIISTESGIGIDNMNIDANSNIASIQDRMVFTSLLNENFDLLEYASEKIIEISKFSSSTLNDFYKKTRLKKENIRISVITAIYYTITYYFYEKNDMEIQTHYFDKFKIDKKIQNSMKKGYDSLRM